MPVDEAKLKREVQATFFTLLEQQVKLGRPFTLAEVKEAIAQMSWWQELDDIARQRFLQSLTTSLTGLR